MEFNLGLDQDLINAVSQIVEASCSAKKMEKEELHPNQVKLDKNKNGKLDSDDFKKLRKEESEDLTEISKKVIGSYVKKASNDLASSVHGERDAEQDDEHDAQEYHAKRAEKRMSGLERAGNKLAKEEVEELDELSKTTLGSYVKKAASSLSKASHDLGDKRAQSAEVERFTNRHMGDKFRAQGKMKDDLGVGNTAQAKDVHTIIKRNKGITSAANKLTKEQFEEIEALAAKHGLGE